jgi:hypothetical protein
MSDKDSLQCTHKIRTVFMRRRDVCRLIAVVLVSMQLVAADPKLFADEATQRPDSPSFSWSTHRTSVADLVIGRPMEFHHGTLDLTPDEQNSYADLLRTIQERRFSVTAEGRSRVDLRNDWESAFYRFEHARRQAFANGKLPQQPVASTQLADPFASSANAANAEFASRPVERAAYSASRYSLVQDMTAYPADFVGRPIVMYGRFSPSGSVEISPAGRFDWESEQLQFQRGILRSLSGDRTLAVVDASGYIDHRHQEHAQPIAASGQGASIPVMVKGWFVKLWGQRPLIYTESIRILEPQPYSDWIQEFTVAERQIVGREKWLYYETLRQMQLTNGAVRARIAAGLRGDRIIALKDEIITRRQVETGILQAQLASAEINEATYQKGKTRLDRQIALRLRRFGRFQNDPDSFPAYVDVFQHPHDWQGKLLTLSGHVRRMVTYAGDDLMMPGQELHELWLFTDDSQHNPAVIVTTDLPEGFPRGAEVVDRVTVTGCFFKMYVYSGQQYRRLAPLILTGGVEWNPTDDQVLSLAAAGHLAASDSRVRRAKRRSGGPIGEAAMLLCGFGAIVVMMTVWGRVQRDRRQRRQLLDLVDEQPDFDQNESIA